MFGQLIVFSAISSMVFKTAWLELNQCCTLLDILLLSQSSRSLPVSPLKTINRFAVNIPSNLMFTMSFVLFSNVDLNPMIQLLSTNKLGFKQSGESAVSSENKFSCLNLAVHWLPALNRPQKLFYLKSVSWKKCMLVLNGKRELPALSFLSKYPLPGPLCFKPGYRCIQQNTSLPEWHHAEFNDEWRHASVVIDHSVKCCSWLSLLCFM